MIQLDDYDHTFIPESEEDCQKLAYAESQNLCYDVGDGRTAEQAAEHRRRGKLEEARLCMWLHEAGFSVLHGVRAGKKYADNGTDIQLGAKHGMMKLQVKSCRSNAVKLFDRAHSSKEEQLRKIAEFDGPIVVVHEDYSTRRRSCWLGDGKLAEEHAACVEDHIEIPYTKCFKLLSMKNGDFEKEVFERLLKEHARA